MITIDICPTGLPVSDWDVEDVVLAHVRDALDGVCYETSTYSNFAILDMFRAELVERPELQQYFKFKVNGEPCVFNRYMRYEDWYSMPKAADLTGRACERILTASMKLHEADKMLATMNALQRLGLDSLDDLELVARKVVEENPDRTYIEQLKELRTVVKGLGLKEAVTVIKKGIEAGR